MAELHTATVKVIKDGRVTIPQEIRELENIKEGDFLRITLVKIDRTKQTS
jgi:AbrB family looped-hinge helix DNA binding protein